jgi:hypothetical protein
MNAKPNGFRLFKYMGSAAKPRSCWDDYLRSYGTIIWTCSEYELSSPLAFTEVVT